MAESTSVDVSTDSDTARADALALDDPDGALRSALGAARDPAVAPEDIVLCWLLRLSDNVDPACAAGRILAAIAAPPGDPPGDPSGDPLGDPPGDHRLTGLLAEVARWPAGRLRTLRHPARPRPALRFLGS